ncbi:hypothetical protein [Streptomyces goshikiensis]|uniref:hypothetical protein n=1 Tax=Streptomyces goshikiensis TaxID=1942 RepID=UPI00365E9F13
MSAWLVRGFGFSSPVKGSMPRTCSHIHCRTPVSWAAAGPSAQVTSRRDQTTPSFSSRATRSSSMPPRL